MLVDKVEIKIVAGRGGNGVISWRHEKQRPKGGPDGGDGGRGGKVIVKSSHNQHTLSSFRYKKVFKADDGDNGSSKNKTGSNGKDLILDLPVGTTIKTPDGENILDLTVDGEEYLIAKGGKGGYGNVHFARSNHQNPFESTEGKPGEEVTTILELSLIADVAFVGLPNAGKTSLIKALTGVEGRIGSYPFSTVDPMLAVMIHNDKNVVLIDLPGMIEGAHSGKGLGDKFLQHINRVKGLIHVVDSTDKDLPASIKTIHEEIEKYDPNLAAINTILVFNKIDLLDAKEIKTIQKKYPKAILVSAHDEKELSNLKNSISLLT